MSLLIFRSELFILFRKDEAILDHITVNECVSAKRWTARHEHKVIFCEQLSHAIVLVVMPLPQLMSCLSHRCSTWTPSSQNPGTSIPSLWLRFCPLSCRTTKISQSIHWFKEIIAIIALNVTICCFCICYGKWLWVWTVGWMTEAIGRCHFRLWEIVVYSPIC